MKIIPKLSSNTLLTCSTGIISLNVCCFIFQGNIALEKSKRKKPYDWFPDEGWEDCIRLVEVFPEKYGTLLEDIERNEKLWKQVPIL